MKNGCLLDELAVKAKVLKITEARVTAFVSSQCEQHLNVFFKEQDQNQKPMKNYLSFHFWYRIGMVSRQWNTHSSFASERHRSNQSMWMNLKIFATDERKHKSYHMILLSVLMDPYGDSRNYTGAISGPIFWKSSLDPDSHNGTRKCHNSYQDFLSNFKHHVKC